MNVSELATASRDELLEEALQLYTDKLRLLSSLRGVISWVPGREVWHTDAAEEAVSDARAVIADVTRADTSGAKE